MTLGFKASVLSFVFCLFFCSGRGHPLGGVMEQECFDLDEL
jgi:hypothetical protein